MVTGEKGITELDLSVVSEPEMEFGKLTWRTKFAVVIVSPDGIINVMARHNTSGDEHNARALAAVLMVAADKAAEIRKMVK